MSGFSLPATLETPYHRGIADGLDGTPYQRDAYRVRSQQEGYARGWSRGYYKALGDEIAAYNRLHGTVWEPRIGVELC